MSFIAGFLAAAALAAPAAATAQAATILPGYWESKNRVFPLPAKTDLRCIAAKDIKKFLAGPSNHIYHCVYPLQEAAAGKVAFSGYCEDKKGRRYEISGSGDYTPTTLEMTAKLSGKFGGIPLTFQASTHARRISKTCPPGQMK
ncbi:MAG: DUF3617 domain-containing protein [Caulobacteraceae bacterium]